MTRVLRGTKNAFVQIKKCGRSALSDRTTFSDFHSRWIKFVDEVGNCVIESVSSYVDRLLFVVYSMLTHKRCRYSLMNKTIISNAHMQCFQSRRQSDHSPIKYGVFHCNVSLIVTYFVDEFHSSAVKITEGRVVWQCGSTLFRYLENHVFGPQKHLRPGLSDPPWPSPDTLDSPPLSSPFLFLNKLSFSIWV